MLIAVHNDQLVLAENAKAIWRIIVLDADRE